MKGISEMIAVILLIAFTVAVGGILSLWFSSTASSTTGITGATAKNQTQCAGASISIDAAGSTVVRYSNPSLQTVGSISLLATDGNNVWTLTTGQSLTTGSAGSVAWTKGANTSLIASGLCQSSIPVSGRCDNTMTCWGLT